jgi:hypothetical protein
VPRRTFAPTALAPIAPRKARKPKDAADTMGLKLIRAVTLGRKRGLEGGRARADKMSTAERAEIARKPPPMSRCRRSPPSTSSKTARLRHCGLRGPRAGSQIDRLPVNQRPCPVSSGAIARRSIECFIAIRNPPVSVSCRNVHLRGDRTPTESGVQLDQDWSLRAFTAEFLRRSDSTDSFRASATKGEAERRGPRLQRSQALG